MRILQRRTLAIVAMFWCALAAIAAIAIAARDVRSRQPSNPGSTPGAQARINHPSLIDLGRKDRYKSTRVLFRVGNDGDEALVVNQVETSCACQGVFELTSMLGVKDYPVAPGASAVFGVNVPIDGTLGEPSQIVLRLRSNDPTNPVSELTIVYVPSAALYAIPGTIVHSQVDRSQLSRFDVQLFADERCPLVTTKPIETSLPDAFAARFAADKEGRTELGDSRIKRIGTLSIVMLKPVTTDNTFETILDLTQDGKNVLRLPISIKYLPAYGVFPQTVTLPRHSDGQWIYSFTCTCTRHDGRPFALKLESIDSGLTAMHLGAGSLLRTHTLSLSVEPSACKTPREYSVRFSCMAAEGNGVTLQVPVRVIPPQE